MGEWLARCVRACVRGDKKYLPADAEIRELRLTSRVDQHVVCLHVAVNFLVKMQVQQTKQHIARNHRNLLFTYARSDTIE